jgi:general secretion pathway protein J
VAITPLEEWQIFFFRGDSWTNPLSSGAGTPVGTGQIGVVGGGSPTPTTNVLPDGVRLVLLLPQARAIGGRLQRDWVRPTLSGSRS